MSNWFVLDKNDNIFADVEEEDEARELAITYVTDPWTEDAAPFKVMSYDEYTEAAFREGHREWNEDLLG